MVILLRAKLLLYCIFCLTLTTPLKALAQTQVNPDGTLSTNVNTSDGRVYEISGGARPNNGANLFHSLKDFSIQSGDTGRFIYDPGINNIITRVTGRSPSNINGTIQTLINGTTEIGNANLFLINPNGIIFGENAKLDIGGSFIGSTADRIKFADGTEFSTQASQGTPLLTITAPIGLQFGSRSSTIRVNGSGNNLILNRDFSIDNSNRPDGLTYQTPNGQTLALVAGNLELDGGNITVPQGRIELWSVNNGEVKIANSSGQLQLESRGEINYGNIQLLNAASVDASGNSGGFIQVKGQNVNLQDGSIIITDTKGNGTGGTLNISASNSVNVKGFFLLNPDYVSNPDEEPKGISSAILADVAPGASGTGGTVTVATKTLQISDGGQISSGTFGSKNAGKTDSANAGELTVTAEDIQLTGFSPFGPSGLFAPVVPGAEGDGGQLTINTNSLQLVDGAQIFTSTFGFGKAGDLKIVAQDVEVKGGTELGPSSIQSSTQRRSDIPEPLANSLGVGFGTGGNLTIETDNLRVADGGQIAVSTTGIGSAGNLKITANSVEISGSNQFASSGLFASAVVGNGEGGDLEVNANRLLIKDGATINASNFFSRDPDNLRGLAGQGAAGNIKVNSGFILLTNQARITSDTNAGDNGNITIQSENIQMRNGSNISANARNSSIGGNIVITTNTLVALENSDITANAEQGFGGQVVVNAKGILGTEFRPQLSPKSDITASSDLGAEFNGTVELNTPDADPSTGLVKLASDFSDRSQKITSGCAAVQQNSFTISNRGGLPANPTATIRGQIVWNDIRDLSNQITKTTTNSNYQPTNHPESIVEAQGLIVRSDGTIELVATIPQENTVAPWQKAAQCNGDPHNL